jgi:hypothetical protein
MSLVAQSPQPSFAWSFDGTTTDYMSGLAAETPVQTGSNTNMFNGVAIIANAPTSNIALYFPGTTGSYTRLVGTSTAGAMSSVSLTTTNVFCEFWIYLNSFKSINILLSKNFQNSGGSDYWASIDGSGNFSFNVTDTLGFVTTSTPASTVQLNNWTYVAFGWDNLTKTLYSWVNGGSPVTTSLSGTANNFTTSVYSGWDGGSNYLDGYIQDIRFISGSIIPINISTPSNAPFTYSFPSYISTGTVTYAFPSQTFTYGNKGINFINTPGTSGNSYVNYNFTPSLGSTVNSYSYSVSMWFYQTIVSSTAQVAVTISGLNAEGDWRFQVGNQAAFRYNIQTGPTTFSINSISSGVNIVINTWHHMVGIVQETSSSTTMSLYYNGKFIGSFSTAFGTLREFPRMGVGNNCTGQLFAAAYRGYVKDVRVYSGVLSASHVQSIYNQQGMPARMTFTGYSQISLFGTPLSSQLSSAATSSVLGAFSLHAVSGATARVVQIRRSSDSVTQDFYADRLGNLLTTPVTGQPLASWLSESTGYVTTWYDQSGRGNHMSCSNIGLQPKIDTTNGWIDFKPSAYFDTSANPSAGPVPWDSTKNYTVVCHHNTIGSTYGGICETFSTDLQSCNEFYKTTTPYVSYWLNVDNEQAGGIYSVDNRVTFKWDGANRYIYINGSLQSTQFETSLWVQNSSGTQKIGYNSFFNQSMNGEMYNIFMFNSALSDVDRTLVENSY